MLSRRRFALNNPCFILFIILGFFEPGSVSDLSDLSGGIWSYIDVFFKVVIIIDIIIALGLAVRILELKTCVVTILLICMQIWIIIVNAINDVHIVSVLFTSAKIISFMLLLEVFAASDRLISLMRVLSWLLNIYVLINLITIIIYPNGCYTDSFGWTYNYFLDYKNVHIYYFLPCILFNAVYDIKLQGRVNTIKMALIVGIMALSSILDKSGTTLICMLFIFVNILLFRKKSLPSIISPEKVFLLSAFASMIIVSASVSIKMLSLLIDKMQKSYTYGARQSIWKEALIQISKHPILGNGYKSLNMPFLWNVTQCHNKFLDDLYVGGIPYFVFVMIVFLFCLYYLRNKNGLNYNFLKLVIIGYCIVYLMEAKHNDIFIYAVLLISYRADKYLQTSTKVYV